MSRYELTDKILWLLVPIALAASYYASQNLLQNIRDVTTAPPVEETTTPKKVDDDAEDHIPPDALRKLSDGHSFELRKAAFRIALSQSLKPEAKKALLKDLASKNSERRDNGVFALWYLIYGPDLNEEEYSATRLQQQTELQQPATYQAIITALVNLLPFHARSTHSALSANEPPPSPVRPLQRPTHEATLVLLLLELIRAFNRNPTPEGGIHTALEAGLVQRWLAKYPFPCTLPQYSKLNLKRSDVSELLFHEKAYSRDDDLMAEVFRQVLASPSGRAQLRAVGLARQKSRLKEDFRHENSGSLELEDWENIARDLQPRNRNTIANLNEVAININDDSHSETSAWRSFHPPVRHPIRRRSIFDVARSEGSTQTAEQFRQRRRNREAIVVADPETSSQASDEDRTTSRSNSIQVIQPVAAEGSDEIRRSRHRHVDANGEFGHRINGDGARTGTNSSDMDGPAYAASHLSFSSVGSAGTPDSLPGLMSPPNYQILVSERINQQELASRLGAIQINERNEDGDGRDPDRVQSIRDLLEMAVRARERARGAVSWREREQTGEGDSQ